MRIDALSYEVRNLRRENDGLHQQVHQLGKQVIRLSRQLEAAKATVKKYSHMLFSRKSEQGAVPGSAACAEAQATEATLWATEPGEQSPEARRPRGQVRGRRGHGRHLGQGLPMVEELLVLPEEQRCCPNCGAPYAPMPGAVASSVVLDWVVQLCQHRYLRQKYRRTCNCPDSRPVIIAPRPPKVVRKGGFSAQFIARLCLEKFALARPLHKVVQVFAWQGAELSAGTLTGVVQEIMPLLTPLYQAICERVRQSDHNQGDETGYTMLDEEQHPHRWWLWIVASFDAVAFLLDPQRSADVPRRFFGWLEQAPPAAPLRTLLTDCFSAYKSLVPWIVQAFCWAHLRRRFRDAPCKAPQRQVIAWAEAWQERIAELYHRHRARRRAPQDSDAWQAADQALRKHVDELHHVLHRELGSPQIHPQQRAVLEHFQRHWEGYIRFLDDPALPLDNNWMERLLRTAVLGRKNFNFLGSTWAGEVAAMLWSIFATARANALNPLSYLTAYLQACAEAGGQPLEGDALARFLPWALTAEDRAAWSAPLPVTLPGATHEAARSARQSDVRPTLHVMPTRPAAAADSS